MSDLGGSAITASGGWVSALQGVASNGGSFGPGAATHRLQKCFFSCSVQIARNIRPKSHFAVLFRIRRKAVICMIAFRLTS